MLQGEQLTPLHPPQHGIWQIGVHVIERQYSDWSL